MFVVVFLLLGCPGCICVQECSHFLFFSLLFCVIGKTAAGVLSLPSYLLAVELPFIGQDKYGGRLTGVEGLS